MLSEKNGKIKMNKNLIIITSILATIITAIILFLISKPRIIIYPGQDMPTWIADILKNSYIFPKTINLKDLFTKPKPMTKEYLKVKFKIF